MDNRDSALKEAAGEVQKRLGKTLLSNQDLLIMTYDEISRTVSYEEKHYNVSVSCKKY